MTKVYIHFMNGKGARQKGHSFERWVANQLKSVFPKAKRHLEYQMGEANGVDIAYTGEFCFQCKRGRKYASINAIKEVQKKGIPVLVTQGDYEEPMCVLPFRDFLDIIKLLG